MTAPIVKWAGGKTRLLPELVRRMPKSFGRYFEPFAGGAALFFHIAPEKAVIGDSNKDLINAYQVIGSKKGVENIIPVLRRHQRKHSAKHYYETRDRWNEWSPWRMSQRGSIERAAAFLYLNRACFNGLWRVNGHGHFNVPMGKYESPRICNPLELHAAAAAISRATVRHDSYHRTVRDAVPGDFLYFDPPYDPIKEESFTSYSKDRFGILQQAELAELVHRLAKEGCHVMVSNSDTPLIRRLYKGLRIARINAPRSVGASGASRGKARELIITSRYPERLI